MQKKKYISYCKKHCQAKVTNFLKSDEKFRPTKISPDKASPKNILKICLNDLLH